MQILKVCHPERSDRRERSRRTRSKAASQSARSALLNRPLQLTFIAFLIAIFTMGASNNAVRYKDLNHKMMCVCSCGQILGECNHLGCQYSEQELSDLRIALSQGKGDNEILNLFQAKYGPTVLAAPMLTKFNIIAWLVPPALLILGIAGTFLLVRKWKFRTVAMPAPSSVSGFDSIRNQIRKDTEL